MKDFDVRRTEDRGQKTDLSSDIRPQSSDFYRRQLARIHCLKKQLGMDDDAYRHMLREIGGADSASDLTPDGRAKVIRHLARLAGAKKQYPGRPHNADIQPQIRKIEALLAEAKRPWGYALALCKRIAKKDRIEFCDTDDLRKIIAALEYDKRRRPARAD